MNHACSQKKSSMFKFWGLIHVDIFLYLLSMSTIHFISTCLYIRILQKPRRWWNDQRHGETQAWQIYPQTANSIRPRHPDDQWHEHTSCKIKTLQHHRAWVISPYTSCVFEYFDHISTDFLYLKYIIYWVDFRVEIIPTLVNEKHTLFSSNYNCSKILSM